MVQTTTKFGIFLALQTLLFGVFMNRSPLMMETTTPTGKWADEPMKIITTPQSESQKTDLFTTGATHMCLLHNSIIRGFNSIYLQAPHVQGGDKAGFVGYALTWHKFVQSHHDDEERNLFTKMEEVLGDKDVFAETHAEHESFLPGLAEFRSYLSGLASPADFSPDALLRIMDSFKEPFEHHFHHEIASIAALVAHPSAPAEGTIEAAAASKMFKAWGKKTVSQAGVADVVPFFLLNLDGTAEGGAWMDWPPMPAPVRWALVNVVGSWWGGARWKFSSCDGAGSPRELYALSNEVKG